MALTQDQIAQLQRVIEGGADATEEDIVKVLNANMDGAEFVRQSSLDSSDIPDTFFKRFTPADVSENRRQVVTQGAWSGGEGTLRYDTMNSFGAQTGEESGDYFWEVYDADPATELEGSRIQFYVAYGNRDGEGSARITTSNPTAQEASRAVYAQHKNALVPPARIGENIFETDGGVVGTASNPVAEIPGTDDFFVINVARARYKQTLDPGNWEIRLVFPGPPEVRRGLGAIRAGFQEGGGAYQGPIVGSGSAQGKYGTVDQGLPPASQGNYSVVKLVDESALTDFANEQLNAGQVGRRLRVLSGSLNLDRTGTSTPDVIEPESYSRIGEIPQQPYGYFYPDAGVILLDPKMLQYHAIFVNREGPARNLVAAGGGGTVTSDGLALQDEFQYEDLTGAAIDGDFFETAADASAAVGDPASDPSLRAAQIAPVQDADQEYQNHAKLFRALKRGGYFAARSAEEVISRVFFVRARNRDFNFSNNPTFVNPSDGRIRNEEQIGNPQVYVTTVGLYDDDNNLVAVAKLSNPQLKDFQNELLIRIKLDYVFVFFMLTWMLELVL